MHRALFYDHTESSDIVCRLCPHTCRIPAGSRGICGVRRNTDGELYSLVYGRAIAEHLDPIEKKPLFHFLPGSQSYSIATVGCNFTCRHCQNTEIAHLPRTQGGEIAGAWRAPEDIVRAAGASGAASIACTYTEPTIYYEYALDVARLAQDHGLKTVFVTNGFITAEPLRTIAPFLAGANIDLKSFRNEFYTSVCGGRLQPVLDTIRRCRDLGIWVEVTTLLIPGYNDSPEEVCDIARFLAGVDKRIPWHVTAFFPTARLRNAPPTPPDVLQRSRAIGHAEGLQHVYTGNIPGLEGESTVCPACGSQVITRRGFRVLALEMKNGRCAHCGAAVSGVFA